MGREHRKKGKEGRRVKEPRLVIIVSGT